MTDPDTQASEQERRLIEILAAFFDDADLHGDCEELIQRYPELASGLREFFAQEERFDQLAQREFGGYEILEEIGRGGMGVVYKARQIDLDRIVALKTLMSGPSASDIDVQRFRKEAQAVADLDHPNVVPIYEINQYHGCHYFTMKFVDSGDLASRLQEYQANLRGAVAVVETVAKAIHHAHERNILHRDLKPSNVLVDREGQPLIADFGLAMHLNESDRLSLTGDIIGTPGYLSPEQASGRIRAVDCTTDVYGLGALLYALLTGQAPFAGESRLDVIRRVREDPPIPPSSLNPQVDPDLESVILKCLQKEQSNRYASAESFAENLKRWLAGKPIDSRPVGKTASTWQRFRERPVLSSLVLGIAIVLMTALAVFLVMIFGNNGDSANVQPVIELTDAAIRAKNDGRFMVSPPKHDVAKKKVTWEFTKESGLDFSPLEKALIDFHRDWGIHFHQANDRPLLQVPKGCFTVQYGNRKAFVDLDLSKIEEIRKATTAAKAELK